MRKGCEYMIHIAIIDDDKLFLEQASQKVDHFFQGKYCLFEIETFDSLDGFKKDSIEKFDILILDICFSKGNGIDFAKSVQKINPYISIIFISSYLEKATEVYEVSHLYFVYKNQIDIYLDKALIKALDSIQKRSNDLIKIRWKNTSIQIPQADILYMEKSGRKLYIVTKDENKYCTYQKFDDVLNQCQNQIVRVHMSYAVNLDYVIEFHREYVLLKNDIFIAVSRRYWMTLKEHIKTLFD